MFSLMCQDHEGLRELGAVDVERRHIPRSEEERLAELTQEVDTSTSIGKADQPVIALWMERPKLPVDTPPVVVGPAAGLDDASREPRHDLAKPWIDVALRQNACAPGKRASLEQPSVDQTLDAGPRGVAPARGASQALNSGQRDRRSSRDRGARRRGPRARPLVVLPDPRQLDRLERSLWLTAGIANVRADDDCSDKHDRPDRDDSRPFHAFRVVG